MAETTRPGPEHYGGKDPGRPSGDRPSGRGDAGKNRGPRDNRRGKAKARDLSRASGSPERAAEIPDLSELTPEDFEILRQHEFFVDFEEGMWLYYKDNVGDGKSEEEQKADFEILCQENARQHLEYLLKNGELKDFEEYLDERKGESKEDETEDEELGGTDDNVAPTEKSGTELTGNWWEGKVFINPISGESVATKAVADEAQRKMIFTLADGSEVVYDVVTIKKAIEDGTLGMKDAAVLSPLPESDRVLTAEAMAGQFESLKIRAEFNFDQDKYLRDNNEGLKRLEAVLKALADLVGLESSNLNFVKFANHGASQEVKIRNIYFPLENLAYLKEHAAELEKITQIIARAKNEGFKAGCAMGDGPAVEATAVSKEYMRGKFREYKNLTIRWNHSPQEILKELNVLDFSKVPVITENLSHV